MNAENFGLNIGYSEVNKIVQKKRIKMEKTYLPANLPINDLHNQQ